jgi:OmpA family
MNPRMFLSMAMATVSLLFAVGCSSDAKKKSSEAAPKTAAVSREMPSEHYTSLSFDPGETRLSSMDQSNLEGLVAKVKESGREIDDIKILTWADREYKQKDQANNSEVILARQRAESIKNYLQNGLQEDADIDYYNMAQKPAPLSRFFKASNEKIIRTFKANNDVNMMNPNHSSKALVIIEYEDGTATNI